MTDGYCLWRSDPEKWAACGHLEEIGACIGPFCDGVVHVELLRLAGGTQVQDAVIPDIVKNVNLLPEVTTLDLGECQISDFGAFNLGQLKNVSSLYLGDVDLTAAGLKCLAAIPSLNDLAICGRGVTDKLIVELKTANGLLFLKLFGTSVTNRGEAHLARLLPNVQIERGD